MSKNDIESIYPLAPVQQGMLFAALARPDLFIEQVEFGLAGALDAAILEAAWGQVVARHPMLRTGFVWKDRNKPVQFVLRRVSAPFRMANLTVAAEPDRELEALRDSEQRAGFKLGQAPLTRLLLVRMAPDHHRIVWTVHHILIDGWCNSILIGDLLSCYAALKQGVSWNRPPARLYRDYVQWLGKRDRIQAEQFWRRYLLGATTATAPGQTGRLQTMAGGHLVRTCELDTATAERLAKALRARHLTWASLCHALWALALAWSSSQQQEVLFGSTLGARPSDLAGIDGTIGPFISSLPVLARPLPTSSWPSFLAGLQSALLGIREHGFCTTAEVHGWSQVPATAPLFHTLLVFENYPMPDSEDPALDDQPRLLTLDGDGARTPYPLSVVIAAADRGVRIKLVADAAHLDDAGVDSLLRALVLLLGQAASAIEADRSLGDSLSDLASEPLPVFQWSAHTDGEADPGFDPEAACQTDVERRIAAIWARVFGVDRIAANIDFFALGGHSLLATELIDAMRAEVGLSVSLSELFAHASVRALAAQVGERLASDVPDAEGTPTLAHDAAGRHEPFLLTDIQQAYWIGRSDAVSMGNVATHSYLELDVADQDPDFDRFEAALDALVRRHDMLRAIFDAEGMQRILAETPSYEVKVHDLRLLNPQARRLAVERTRERMSHEVLPADRWPLFAVEVSWLAERTFRIHLSIDMLIVDGGSQQLLIRDFIGLHLGQAEHLPKLRITFRDYVLALDKLRAGPGYQRARQYWLERAPSLPAAPDLPLAVDPASLQAPRFSRRQKHFSISTWQALGQRARALGISESTLVCGLYAEVLRSFSRSPSFCINLTLFDRRPLHEDVVNLVGDFTSTSILECAPGEGSALADRLRALQQRMWSDMDHSLFSGVEVLRELNRHQGGSRAQMPVVFTSGLVFAGQGAGLGALDAGHQEAGAGESYSIGQTSQVWMDLMALNSGGGLLLYLDAVDALFPAGMVDALFEVLCGLIERIAVDETLLTRVRVAELPAADADSRRVYNDTDVDWDIPPLHGPALMCSHRGPALLGELRTIGHAELRRSVGTLAANLKSAGVCRGDAVGVMMHKGAEQVLACLAILSLGAYYVPVDSHQPPDRREGLLRQVGTRTVLVQPGAAQEGIPDGVLRIDVSMDVPGPPAPGVPESAADPNDLAYVIFTSGSTGMPKGVAIDHRGASNTCVDVNRRFGINAGDRALALSALNFDLSVWDMFGVLGAGGAMVIPDADRLREPGHWLDLIYQHQVSVINAVPALVQMLIDHLEIGQLRLPESVRLIMMSGDWIPVNLPARIRAVSSADIQLISMGGATEASIWSIWYPIQAVPANWKSIPYGMPLANQRFHVLHADLSPCPTHVVGDLYIGGIGLAKGYFGDPERTAASFVVHPDTGERLYRTGDLGRFLADGMIEFLGREDGQVKVQGHRIELSEVEANLLAHPEVQEAAVDARGQGAARALYGWIVPRARPQEDGYAPAQSSFGPVLVDPVERSLFKFQRRGVRSSNGDVLVFSEDDSRRLLPAPVLDESGQLRFEQLGQLLSRFRAYPITDGGLPKYYYPSAGSLYPVQLYLQLNGDAVPGVAGGGYYYDPHQHALVKVSAEVSATAHICVHAVAELDAIAPLYGDLSLAFSELEAGYLSALLPPIHHHGCWQSQVAGSDLQAALGLSTSQRALRSWEWQANTPLDPDSLANPDLAGMSLFARQSFRTFDESTLPAVELSLLQEALAEIVGVEALLLVKPGRVEGVAGGLYRVDGAALTLLSADHIALSEVFDVGAASLFGKAAFAWFLAGEDSPSGRIRIGHAAGRLSAAAAVAGTGLCAVGTFDSRPIQSLVDALQRLDGGTRLVQHALLGGGVPESAKLSRSEPVSEGRSDLASAIQSFLRTRLPDYMVPKTLFLLERMPLSSNGKVDRKAMELPERPVAEAQTGTPLADRIDMALAALWEEVLGVRPHAREDNFVALGGNSISLVQIFTRLRAHHGVQVSLRQLFESPTFAFMRELLLRAGGVGEAQGHEHALIAQLRELRLRQWLAQMSERELDERLGELAREAE